MAFCQTPSLHCSKLTENSEKTGQVQRRAMPCLPLLLLPFFTEMRLAINASLLGPSRQPLAVGWPMGGRCIRRRSQSRRTERISTATSLHHSTAPPRPTSPSTWRLLAMPRHRPSHLRALCQSPESGDVRHGRTVAISWMR